MAISDIYDKQVEGPKSIPKKIKHMGSNNIVYENESGMNGGKILGANLHGFSGYTEFHKSANFGNEF